ncbi:MAG: Spy/CpxP family protein refolding chaperone [Bryobacteraceae bacterium]
MNNRLMGIPVAAALAAGMLFAQTPAPAPHPGRAGHLERMAQFLNLTPQQREQVKAIFEQARQSAAPIQQQLKQGRESIANAAKSGNDAAVDSAANAQGVLMGQLIATHAKAMGKVYQLLTPEQKQKADQMRQHFGQGGMGPGMMGPRRFGPRDGVR